MKGVGEERGEMNGGLTGREKVRRVDLKGAFFIEACHGGRCQDPASTISASRGVDIIKEADERYAFTTNCELFRINSFISLSCAEIASGNNQGGAARELTAFQCSGRRGDMVSHCGVSEGLSGVMVMVTAAEMLVLVFLQASVSCIDGRPRPR